LPFSKAEAAVVLHKFILQAATKQRQPIDLSPDVKRYVGHCRWKIPKDGEFCIKLAEEHYSWDYGARPLSYAALEVERAVFEADAEMTDEEFTEATNDGPLQEFIVRLDLYGPDNYDINVSAVPQQGPDGGGAVA
jgi:ATP-dependent Clp protease ATP-binding subunit ClpB